MEVVHVDFIVALRSGLTTLCRLYRSLSLQLHSYTPFASECGSAMALGKVARLCTCISLHAHANASRSAMHIHKCSAPVALLCTCISVHSQSLCMHIHTSDLSLIHTMLMLPCIHTMSFMHSFHAHVHFNCSN